MTLEDYCLERDLLLDQTQLIREGHAITRYLRTHFLPGPHKLPHDQYGTVDGYRRCTLDRWHEEFMARKWVKYSTGGPWRQPQTAALPGGSRLTKPLDHRLASTA